MNELYEIPECLKEVWKQIKAVKLPRRIIFLPPKFGRSWLRKQFRSEYLSVRYPFTTEFILGTYDSLMCDDFFKTRMMEYERWTLIEQSLKVSVASGGTTTHHARLLLNDVKELHKKLANES